MRRRRENRRARRTQLQKWWKNRGLHIVRMPKGQLNHGIKERHQTNGMG